MLSYRRRQSNRMDSILVINLIEKFFVSTYALMFQCLFYTNYYKIVKLAHLCPILLLIIIEIGKKQKCDYNKVDSINRTQILKIGVQLGGHKISILVKKNNQIITIKFSNFFINNIFNILFFIYFLIKTLN